MESVQSWIRLIKKGSEWLASITGKKALVRSTWPYSDFHQAETTWASSLVGIAIAIHVDSLIDFTAFENNPDIFSWRIHFSALKQVLFCNSPLVQINGTTASPWLC